MVIGCSVSPFSISCSVYYTKIPLVYGFSVQSLHFDYFFCLDSVIKVLICFNFILQLKLSKNLAFISVFILLILGLVLNPLIFSVNKFGFFFSILFFDWHWSYIYFFISVLILFNFLFDFNSFNFSNPSEIVPIFCPCLYLYPLSFVCNFYYFLFC